MCSQPDPSSARVRRLRRYALWFVWVGLVLTGLLLTVAFKAGWGVFTDHWDVAVAMAIGSYVAGSTPMGGGTVGFPVLVLLNGEAASFGRQFSFFIQAVGMTSASIFIACSRRLVAWRMLGWACVASVLSLVPVYLFVSPIVGDTSVKLVFACIWGGFGILTLVKLRELLAHHDASSREASRDMLLGLTAGALGGAASALTGVGIDMVVFVLLVLVYRADLKVAVSTSVIAMAFNSIIGTILVIGSGRVQPGVFDAWLAAAPVVLFGAPIGAFAVSRLPRAPTLVFVAVLCVVQLFWAIWKTRPDAWTLAAVVAGVLAINGAFHVLHGLGNRLAGERLGRA